MGEEEEEEEEGEEEEEEEEEGEDGEECEEERRERVGGREKNRRRNKMPVLFASKGRHVYPERIWGRIELLSRDLCRGRGMSLCMTPSQKACTRIPFQFTYTRLYPHNSC